MGKREKRNKDIHVHKENKNVVSLHIFSPRHYGDNLGSHVVGCLNDFQLSSKLTHYK